MTQASLKPIHLISGSVFREILDLTRTGHPALQHCIEQDLDLLAAKMLQMRSAGREGAFARSRIRLPKLKLPLVEDGSALNEFQEDGEASQIGYADQHVGL